MLCSQFGAARRREWLERAMWLRRLCAQRPTAEVARERLIVFCT